MCEFFNCFYCEENECLNLECSKKGESAICTDECENCKSYKDGNTCPKGKTFAKIDDSNNQESDIESTLITKKQLINNAKFRKWLGLEYGYDVYDVNEFKNMKSETAYNYMRKWYATPEVFCGPTGEMKEKIKRTLKYGVIHDCRIRWFVDDK